MKERHTPGPWDFEGSTEDYQGHFILGNGRTVAATYTEDPTAVTQEDVANMSHIVFAPAMLSALRRIAREVNFRQEDGAMELGERLMAIERDALAAIASYETRITKTGGGQNMTMTITSQTLIGCLVDKVREIASARPDTVYRPAWSEGPLPKGQCSYLGGTCSDGSVGCLVGQALLAIGFTTDQLRLVDHLDIEEALEELHPCQLNDKEYDQRCWLETVQSAQDNGEAWQEAVRRADQEEPL